MDEIYLSRSNSLGVFPLACLFLGSLAGMNATAQVSQQSVYARQLQQTSGGSTQEVKSLQGRLAAQSELFKRQWDDDMQASPETATAYGDYRYNGLLSDSSLAARRSSRAAFPIRRSTV